MLPKLALELLPDAPDPAVEEWMLKIQLNNGRYVIAHAHAIATQTSTSDQMIGWSSEDISTSSVLLIWEIR